MTEQEAVEAGARALHRKICKVTTTFHNETEEEAWDRRWEKTSARVQDECREEARAVLEAAGAI